jgi:hypothetical protein
MATYKEIHGIAVKDESSDPTTTGEIFYNSTTDTFRSIVQSAAWVSQTPTVSQHGDGTGCGTASATLLWGGYAPSNQQPPSGYTTTSTEEFNGSGWTAGGNYPVSFFRAGSAGTQTAALGIAGRTGNPAANQDDCFKYDGSTWTATTNYPASKNGVGATGTQTAAIAVGGAPYVDTSFEFDGSSWTSSGTYPTARVGIRGAGTQTAGIFAGGSEPVVSTATTYDGSSFSVVGSLNTARTLTTHSGNSGSSVLCGGALPPGPSNATERWDGTSWTTSPATMSTGGFGGGAGAMSNPAGNTSALMGALRGPPSSYPTNIEEFNVSINTITAAAWASGGTLNTARDTYMGGSRNGTQTAFRTAGGYASSNVVNNESYNGTSFTEEADLNTARRGAAGAGTEPAALYFGGYTGTVYTGATEEWNGSSWSEQNDMSSGRDGQGSCGTQTAAISMGGNVPPRTNAAEEYDGTSWTSGGNMPAVFSNRIGLGIQTAALAVGGQSGDGPTSSTQVDSYNGTAFSTLPASLPSAKEAAGGAGTTTAALVFGGVTNPATTIVNTALGYDGTSWSTRPNMALTRMHWSGGAGTATAAIAAGGNPPTSTANSEEFTGETSVINAKTLTTS